MTLEALVKRLRANLHVTMWKHEDKGSPLLLAADRLERVRAMLQAGYDDGAWWLGHAIEVLEGKA